MRRPWRPFGRPDKPIRRPHESHGQRQASHLPPGGSERPSGERARLGNAWLLWCLWWQLLQSHPQQPLTILEVTCRLKHFGFARPTSTRGPQARRSDHCGWERRLCFYIVFGTSPGPGARGPAPSKARRVPALKRAQPQQPPAALSPQAWATDRPRPLLNMGELARPPHSRNTTTTE